MKYNDFFPSAYMKAEDIPDGKRYVLTIKEVTGEELDKGQRPKPVASFTKTDKKLVINKTNWHIIAGMHGDDSDDWTGKRITVYSGWTTMAGKKCRGLMVEELEPASPAHGNGKPVDTREPVPARQPLPQRRGIVPMDQQDVDTWDGPDADEDGPPF